MSSHSDAVSRIVLEFPGSRRTGSARPSTAKPRGSGAAFASLIAYIDLIATRCLSAARPLRVGWPPAVVARSLEKSEGESQSLLRKVCVNQFEDMVVLEVMRSDKRAKSV
jgi:hypothetical protein